MTDITDQRFPLWKYHPSGESRKVTNETELARLNEEWGDRPYPQKEEVAVRADCPECASMRARFDQAWKELAAERDSLQSRNDELASAHQTLFTEHELLKDEYAKVKAALDSSAGAGDPASAASKKRGKSA